LERSSPAVMCMLTSLFLLWASYLIRLAEAGGLENRFGLYADCLWYVIVTATTTGYGDLAPETVLGRAVGVLIMMVGIVGAALATAILTERLMFNPTESRFVEAIHAIQLQSHRRRLSACVLQQFFRYILERKRAGFLVEEHRREHARHQARRRLDNLIRTQFAAKRENIRNLAESRLTTKAVVDDIHTHVTGDLTRLIEALDSKITAIQIVMQGNGLE